MQKIVLIERYPSSGFFWGYINKNKKIDELSVEQILTKYQGFEGEPVVFYLIEEEKEKRINEKIKECLELNYDKKCSLLYVISKETHPILYEKTYRIGYEVGFCEIDATIYSSIFNEVIFGKINELIYFKKYLNENLLFPDCKTAKDYVDMHNKLSLEGKDVEDYMEMVIYEIRKFHE